MRSVETVERGCPACGEPCMVAITLDYDMRVVDVELAEATCDHTLALERLIADDAAIDDALRDLVYADL